jgi:hypothetical protein
LKAQEVTITSGFLKDSVQIGESVAYYLTATYPRSLTVLFPDSTFAFTPFEFNKKQFYPTQTNEAYSYDSVLYHLSTFEVDKIQYLSLPVYVVSVRDCTAFIPNPDSVSLIELVTNPPPDSISAQNLELRTNTLYERVFSRFNYIILSIVIGILIVAAIVVWVIFGKRIITHFKLKRLQKNYQKFIETFSGHVQQLTANFSREKTEIAVPLWKKYLEQLEQKPYTKLTSRETMRIEADEQLGTALQRIDRAIYGNESAVLEPLQNLKKFAEERFYKKMEAIKHG